jgi:predicted nucleic acid-binding protein
VIVVDASVMVFALSSPTADGEAARSAMAADDTGLGPAHMPLEVIRTLRKAVVSGRLRENDAVAAYDALLAAEITYIGTSEALLRAVWAMRHNVSAYDAAYLVIAAEHEARLVTFDARLAKAAEQVAPFVSVLTLGPARSSRPRGDDRQAGTGPS